MKYILLLLSFFFLAGCGNSNKGVLPQETMEKIMWDIALGSEYLNNTIYQKHYSVNRAAVSNEMLDQILKNYKITKEQFNKSLDYYTKQDPKGFEVLLDSLTKRQDRIKVEAEKAQFKKDSIQRIADSTKLAKEGKKDSTKTSKDSLTTKVPVPAKTIADTTTVTKDKQLTKKKTTKKKPKKKKKKTAAKKASTT